MTQGAFDSFEHEHLPRTKYDIAIDQASVKPGEQAFEVRTVSALPAIVSDNARTETHLWPLPWRDPTTDHL